MAYCPRALEQKVRELTQSFAAILVTGPRQSGKTSMLSALVAELYGDEAHTVAFDTPSEVDSFRRDPDLFFQNHPGVLFLDEVQHAPEVFPYLKREIDRATGSGGRFRFFLSGSQHFHLMRGVTESLAGRVAVLDLWPFAVQELTSSEPERLIRLFEHPDELEAHLGADYPFSDAELTKAMLAGGYPPVLLAQAPAGDWLEAYRRTFVQRDVRDLSQVADLGRFDRLVTLCAGRTATILNKSDFANSLRIDNKTVDHWLSLLETAYQVVILPAYYANPSSRLRKRPKLLFADSGLGLHLQGIRDANAVLRAPHFGSLFESFVVMEIRKLFGHAAVPWNGYHWSVPRGPECDLVLTVGGRLVPIEVKHTARLDRHDLRGLHAFCERHGDLAPAGIVISMSPRVERVAPGVFNLPLGMLLRGLDPERVPERSRR